MAITKSDLLTLEKLYQDAKSESGDISWKHNRANGLFAPPDYPESVLTLFDYITSSVWRHPNYKPSETSELLSRIKQASMTDIQSVLTHASRSERFCTGSWLGILQEDKLAVVIERIRELVQTQPGCATDACDADGTKRYADRQG